MIIFIIQQVIYLAYYWRNSDYHLLVHKPTERWNTEDVGQWMAELGEWSAPYVHQVHNKSIGK